MICVFVIAFIMFFRKEAKLDVLVGTASAVFKSVLHKFQWVLPIDFISAVKEELEICQITK